MFKVLSRWFVVGVLCVSSVSMIAQDDRLGEITFEDTPQEEKAPAYFAFGGGAVGQFLSLDVTNANTKFKSAFGKDGIKSSMLLTGVQGFAPTLVVPNLRIGFTGLQATQTIDSLVTSSSYQTSKTDIVMTLNGVNLDYGINLAKGLTVLPGVLGGWGITRVETYAGAASAPSWTSTPGMERLESSHIFVQPNLNIEYAFMQYAMVRANVGYTAVVNQGDWMQNRTTTIKNDELSLKPNGIFFGFGIFVGLFN